MIGRILDKHPHSRRCIWCGQRHVGVEMPPFWAVHQLIPTTGKAIYTCSSKCRRQVGYKELTLSA